MKACAATTAACVAFAALGGCSAEPAAAPAASGAPAAMLAPALADGRFPPDFTIDATVLLGPGAVELLTVQDHQAKYVLLPDGGLHAEAGPFVGMSTRPGRSRWLYEDQVQFMWSLCRQLGFLDPAAANGPPNPDMLRAGRGERVSVLTLRAAGQTWTFVRRARDAEAMDAAAARVVRALAVLAFIPDYRPDEVRPERYDYGPDPYAAYREIRARQAPSIAR